MVVEGKPVWVKRSRHNHFLDCEALCAAIGYAMNVQRIPEGVERRTAAELPADPGDPSEGDPPSPPPPTPGGGGAGGARRRFSGIGNRLNR